MRFGFHLLPNLLLKNKILFKIELNIYKVCQTSANLEHFTKSNYLSQLINHIRLIHDMFKI